MILRFRFPHHRGHRMQSILELAAKGEHRPPDPLVPGAWHEVLFDLTGWQNIEPASDLTHALDGQRLARIDAGDGRILRPYAVLCVLNCYLESYRTSDWRAHCWKPQVARETFVEDRRLTHRIGLHLSADGVEPLEGDYRPGAEPDRMWRTPCRHAWFHDLSRTGEIPLRSQVEAAIVARECAWCPRLQRLDEWEFDQWAEGPLSPAQHDRDAD